MEDLISIIIPVYNVEKYLEQCIESMLNQTYRNLEIILVDDGSTDSSASIMRRYAEMDPRIINIFKENFGAPSARNRGIDIATGKYMMFFDSDDELYEDAIQNMVNNIQDADMIMGNWNNIDLDSNIIGLLDVFNNQVYDDEKEVKKLVTNAPFPGNKLYKSDIIKNNKIYFDNVKIGQDLNFYIKFIYYSKKIVTIQDLIFKYRITSNSITRTYNFNIFDIVNAIEKADNFLRKKEGNSLDNDIINMLKIIHYDGQLYKITNYNRKYKKFIILYFYDELKKMNIRNCSENTKRSYYRMIIKCKLYKFISPKIYKRIVKKVKKYVGEKVK